MKGYTKGHNKQFARYLESEYNDDYLKPLQKDTQFTLDNLAKLCSTQQEVNQKNSQHADHQSKKPTLKKPVQSLKPDPRMNLAPLSYCLLRELGAQLGDDAQNCISNISQVVKIESHHVLEAYRQIYRTFQTLPYFFCSYSTKGCYIWQINRLCPYKTTSNSFVLDSKAEGAQKCLHISFLMLGKFTFEEDEELVNIRLLDDTQLIVRTRIGDGFIFRLYDVTSFVSSARINPYKQEVITSHLYSHKLVMKKTRVGKRSTLGFEVTLWKRMISEEPGEQRLTENDELATRIVYESPTANFAHYTDIKKSKNGVILLTDVPTSDIVMWRGDEILNVKVELVYGYIIVPDEDNIISAQQLMTQYTKAHSCQTRIHKIFWEKFPVIHREGETWENHKYEELKEKVKSYDQKQQDLRANLFVSDQSCPEHNIYVYNTPISLVNTYLVDNKAVKTIVIQEDKEEKSLFEKIAKKVTQIKQSKNGISKLQSQKEIMKGIRADLRTRVGEIKKYEEEQEKDSDKVVEKPDEVSKEILRLYAQQKLEKKRIAKRRDKKKGQKKKSRASRKSYIL